MLVVEPNTIQASGATSFEQPQQIGLLDLLYPLEPL